MCGSLQIITLPQRKRTPPRRGPLPGRKVRKLIRDSRYNSGQSFAVQSNAYAYVLMHTVPAYGIPSPSSKQNPEQNQRNVGNMCLDLPIGSSSSPSRPPHSPSAGYKTPPFCVYTTTIPSLSSQCTLNQAQLHQPCSSTVVAHPITILKVIVDEQRCTA